MKRPAAAVASTAREEEEEEAEDDPAAHAGPKKKKSKAEKVYQKAYDKTKTKLLGLEAPLEALRCREPPGPRSPGAPGPGRPGPEARASALRPRAPAWDPGVSQFPRRREPERRRPASRLGRRGRKSRSSSDARYVRARAD